MTTEVKIRVPEARRLSKSGTSAAADISKTKNAL